MRKLVLFFACIIFLTSVYSCKKSTNVKGVYYSDGGLITWIKFEDGRCTMETFGMVTPAYPYEKRGDTIYVTDPQHGDVPFQIVDENTIKCSVFGLAGTYVKE